MFKSFTLCWFLLLSLTAVAAPVTIYLRPDNTVTLRGPIDGQSSMDAVLKVFELSAARTDVRAPIYLVLDTPGGSIDAGNALIEALQVVPNLHTVSIFAASMGSAIVEALPGKRYALSSATLMFHRAAGQFRGYFEIGEVESELAAAKEIVLHMEQRNSKRIGISIKDYKDKVRSEWWLDGQSAVKANVVDSIVLLSCSAALLSQRDVVIADSFMGSFKLLYSGCPLIRIPVNIAAAKAAKVTVPSNMKE